MPEETSYTTEEIAKLLKISKLKVYDLIKKGELPSYRVGKQMRVDASDLEAYKRNARSAAADLHQGNAPVPLVPLSPGNAQTAAPGSYGAAGTAAGERQGQDRTIVITGQDISLDLLAGHLERQLPASRPLRSYAGSLDSLIAMYRGESDIVSTHLLDGDTGEYNLPYIRKLLVGMPYLVVHLLTREAGFYVAKGNPLELRAWSDLKKDDIRLVNRERGAGARVLLDEQLRLHGIPASKLEGYNFEANSHLAVAGAVARGEGDVGIGTEKAARIIGGVDFVPLIRERYDLVMLKKPENAGWIEAVLRILRSPSFHNELSSLHGYDLSETGNIVCEY